MSQDSWACVLGPVVYVGGGEFYVGCDYAQVDKRHSDIKRWAALITREPHSLVLLQFLLVTAGFLLYDPCLGGTGG